MENDECYICYEKLSMLPTVTLTCKHTCCLNCMLKQFNQKNECGMCRKEILKENDYNTHQRSRSVPFQQTPWSLPDNQPEFLTSNTTENQNNNSDTLQEVASRIANQIYNNQSVRNNIITNLNAIEPSAIEWDQWFGLDNNILQY